MKLAFTLIMSLYAFSGFSQEWTMHRVLSGTGAGSGLIDVQNIVYLTSFETGMVNSVSHINGFTKIYEYDPIQEVSTRLSPSMPRMLGHLIGFFDADADDDLDILGLEHILINDGSYNFNLEPAIQGSLPSNSRIIRLVDFDQDGILDITTINSATFGTNDKMNILLLDENRAVKENVFFKALAGTEFGTMKVADFNNDGSSDLVFLEEDFSKDSLVMGINNGDNTFTYDKIHLPSARRIIEFADIDNDGDLDFVIPGFNGTNLYYIENLNGSFGERKLAFVNSNQRISSLKLGDIDLDGYIDIVFLDITNDSRQFRVSMIKGFGDFSFGSQKIITTMNASSINFSSLEQAYENWLILTDYDNDSDLDVGVNKITQSAFDIYENQTVVAGVSNKDGMKIVRLFPNPVEDIVLIESNLEVELIQLVNSSGQYVKAIPVVGIDESISISMRNHPPDLYSVLLQSKSGSYTTVQFLKK